MILLILFAALAGIATVLSPCILPVLPALLSASSTGGKGRPFGVIVGLIASFVFFTLTLTAIVQAFGVSANFLRYVAIIIIALFGLVLLIPKLSDIFAKLTDSFASIGSRVQSHSPRTGFGSGLVIGSALGLVWTPCAGPILAAITTLVATQHVTFSIVILTIAYSLGAGIPLFLIAYGGQRALTTFPWLVRHTERIRQLFGVFMILTALALAFNWDALFQQKVLDFLPSIQLENNAWVQKQLEKIRPSSPFTTPPQEAKNGTLPLIAPAPPLSGASAWINSSPLTMEELRGKVVLIDFWTYSCINCIRTFPYLHHWYDAYKDKNFVIIGVHTPEFEFEKDESNVKNAVERFHIAYPVAMDNKYKIWQAYSNSYWPAHYLIDQQGIIREVHFGEGDYLGTENAIRSLLHLTPLVEKEEKAPPRMVGMTPETYLGFQRGSSYTSENSLMRDEMTAYRLTQPLGPDEVALQGDWTVRSEYILSDGDGSMLGLNFKANRVYLVLGGSNALPVRVTLDGKPLPQNNRTVDMDAEGGIIVKEPRKYDIVDLKGQDGRHELMLQIPKGIRAYAFTFGMEDDLEKKRIE